jgi:DNA-binding PadR family transcriptional regulator
VILGLLAAGGPQTTYDMMCRIDLGIGFFWPFPSSQMYAETKRLERSGFVTADQEEFGRRRRLLTVTEAGREALDIWLSEPTDRPSEIRDIGLLKLYLSDGSDTHDPVLLAGQQLELHRARLEQYREIEGLFEGPRSRGQRTIELGVAFEKVAIEFWENVASNP